MADNFATLTANGSSAAIAWSGGPIRTLRAAGTFGGGTLALKISVDNGSTWEAVTDGTTAASLTATGQINVELHGSFLVRVTLSGATSPNIASGLL